MGSTTERHEGVFGAALEDNVPSIIVTVCTFIERYGLEESDLTHNDSNSVEKLRSLLECSPATCLDIAGTNASSAAAVLRCYLRELPEPLIPDATTHMLIKCVRKQEKDKKGCDQKLKKTLEGLPRGNFRVVEYLSSHLSRLSLSPMSISKSMGPSIFRMREKGLQEDANNVLATIIRRRTQVFGDSSENIPELKQRNTRSEERLISNNAEDSPCGGRKRKESGGSLQSALDRKMIRSSSEERPGRGIGELRRVSSHGDMANPITVKEGCKTRSDSSNSEEGSQKEVYLFRSSSKENVCPNREQEAQEEDHYHPPMDFSNLHGCEPVLSWAHVFTETHEGVTLSPRSSFFVSGDEDSSWAGPDHSSPPSPPLSQQDVRRGEREGHEKPEMRKLTRKIRGLKRQLRDRQHTFEKEYGYRPSQAERITDPRMRELTHHLAKLRRELKHLKEVEGLRPKSPVARLASVTNSQSPSDDSMKETFSHVQQLLQESRGVDGRGDCLDAYSPEQVVAEKQALQRALLMWEREHGRPTEKAARSIIRPFYDRYRMLKRMMLKSSSPKCKDNGSELQPIIEHEETMSWQQMSSQEKDDEEQTEESSSTENTKNYHEMTVEQLSAEYKYCQERKKELGRKIREWEESFQEKSGRKAQKDDRRPLQATFSSYKEAKHNLRLLDALLRKKS